MKTYKKIFGIFIIINIGFNGLRGMNNSDTLLSENSNSIPISNFIRLEAFQKQYIQTKTGVFLPEEKNNSGTMTQPYNIGINDSNQHHHGMLGEHNNSDHENNNGHNGNQYNDDKKPWNKKYIIGGVSGSLLIVGGVGYWAYSNRKNKLIIVNEKKIKN